MSYGPGELGHLAKAFDEMAAALQQRQTDAERAAEVMRKLWSAVEQTADSVIITNREGIIEYVNPAFERETGYRLDEVIGRTPGILKSGQHGKPFYAQMWEAILAGEVFRAVFINRKRMGRSITKTRTSRRSGIMRGTSPTSCRWGAISPNASASRPLCAT
ncbi:MAG: PAS domain-containing protein [Candidatus Methylomirabilis sp.]|nr:PAS domain-containing protein [Candidatus Methylomirabilis sp.]